MNKIIKYIKNELSNHNSVLTLGYTLILHTLSMYALYFSYIGRSCIGLSFISVIFVAHNCGPFFGAVSAVAIAGLNISVLNFVGDTQYIITNFVIAHIVFTASAVAWGHIVRLKSALSIELKKREVAEEKLRKMALYDGLTEVPNLNHFKEESAILINKAKENNHTVSLLYFDLDGFKQINDNYGHGAGDEVLKKFADILNKHIKEDELIARLGGDEFVAIVMDSSVSTFLEKVKEDIKSYSDNSSFNTEIGISVGISNLYSDGVELKDLIKAADSRMYANKKENKQAIAA
jgi:diguanylate cyclase (GGDEF)-like protein